VELPTPGGPVTLKVPPGTRAGQQLRLGGRGMTRGSGAAGNLFALVRIEVPSVVDETDKDLYRKLAESSNFNPRAHFAKEISR
jgi:curved DNA-binding protein